MYLVLSYTLFRVQSISETKQIGDGYKNAKIILHRSLPVQCFLLNYIFSYGRDQVVQ